MCIHKAKTAMPSQKKNDDYQQNIDYNDDGEETKVLRKRRFYPTKIGGLIVNAASGHSYGIPQGSFEELRLYKVSDVTGYYDAHGFLLRRNDAPNREPCLCYYESPEEYTRHMRQKVPQKRINEWHNNVKRMFPDGGEFVKSEYEAIRQEKALGTPGFVRQSVDVESSSPSGDEYADW